jgi:hypothetical protein
MRSSPLLGVQIPDADDVADVPTHLYTVATGLEAHTIITCTSSTRPGATYRFDGMRIFETDTRNEMEWRAATSEWTKPWGGPWGQLGFKGHTDMNSGNAQTTITTVVDVTGTSISWRGFAGRQYRAKTHGLGYCAGTGDVHVLFNLDSIDSAYAFYYDSLTSLRRPIDGTWEFKVATTGTHTIKLRATATLAFAWDNSDQGRYFSLEDLGPAPA